MNHCNLPVCKTLPTPSSTVVNFVPVTTWGNQAHSLLSAIMGEPPVAGVTYFETYVSFEMCFYPWQTNKTFYFIINLASSLTLLLLSTYLYFFLFFFFFLVYIMLSFYILFARALWLCFTSMFFCLFGIFLVCFYVTCLGLKWSVFSNRVSTHDNMFPGILPLPRHPTLWI